VKRTYVKGKTFFSIDNDDKSVTITEGTLGTPGKTQVFKYRSPDKRDAGYSEKLAAALAKGFKQPKPVETTNQELEAAILANPEDEASYAVYADWLQSHDQPRGKLAAVQAAIARLPKGKPADEIYDTCDSEVRETWFLPPKVKGAKALLDQQARLLADHALDPVDYDLADADGYRRSAARLDWQHGFVRAAWLGLGGMSIERLATVKHFVGHPSCRFLRSLTLNEIFDEGVGSTALSAIARVAPRTLRHLHLGDYGIGTPPVSWFDIGNLSPFYRATPDLATLILQGSVIEFGKAIEFPKLLRLEVRTGGLKKAAAKAIAASALPSLEMLLVWFGEPDYGATAKLADIAPLLSSKGFPKLTHLGLANCEFANELAGEIVGAKLIERLRVLDLSMGTLDDEGAKILAGGKRAFAHLETLDLSDNYLTPGGIKLVKGLAKKVLVGEQREPYDWDDDKRRYASVGE
jgi:uncharacterized protein (TIGR02996 family)